MAPALPDHVAAQLRGFGPLGLLAAAAVLLGNGLFAPLSAVLAIAWAWLSRTPFQELGFRRPRSWLTLIAAGIALGVLLRLLMKAVVMPLLGAEPVNQQYGHLAGNAAALPAIIVAIVAGSGFGEETIYRGFLFERLGKLFGAGRGAAVLIVLLTSSWFAAVHYPTQGMPGVAQAMLLGIVLGSLQARTRQLWLCMTIHASFNLTAVALIYWRLEERIAGLFF